MPAKLTLDELDYYAATLSVAYRGMLAILDELPDRGGEKREELVKLMQDAARRLRQLTPTKGGLLGDPPPPRDPDDNVIDIRARLWRL